ncbi:MAG TPA: hypothetical protein DG754_11345, partial [Bacteroidales bacterium]|nr:hypothetical protein [Bacteroidales bacterium]
MKKLVLLLCTILATASLIANPAEGGANFRITGRVLDENNKPLPWAVVAVENTLLGTTVQVDGTYQLNFRKGGSYTLTASFMGYGKVTKQITVDENTQV